MVVAEERDETFEETMLVNLVDSWKMEDGKLTPYPDGEPHVCHDDFACWSTPAACLLALHPPLHPVLREGRLLDRHPVLVADSWLLVECFDASKPEFKECGNRVRNGDGSLARSPRMILHSVD